MQVFQNLLSVRVSYLKAVNLRWYRRAHKVIIVIFNDGSLEPNRAKLGWGLKLEWNPISVFNNAPSPAIRETSNYSNIKVQFASLSSISERLYIFRNLLLLSKLFLFYLRDALKAICLLIIPSDLDGFLIKFSINCDLNKVPKLSNYCIYKSTANGGHFWVHARHPIAMMICLEKWKTNVSQTNCTL